MYPQSLLTCLGLQDAIPPFYACYPNQHLDFAAVLILNEAHKSHNLEILCLSVEKSRVELPNLVTLDCDSLIMSDNDRGQATFGMQLPNHLKNRIPGSMVQVARR